MLLQSKLVLPALIVGFAVSGAAQQAPPVRPLGAAVAISSEPFTTIIGVREVPGGVLVNDMAKRRVLMLDPTLKTFNVIADSLSSTSNYGRAGGLIAYRGDSTLFVDATSLSILVFDGTGKIGRVMSVPRSQDVGALIGPNAASVGFDQSGRMVYRSPIRPTMPPMSANGVLAPPAIPDSSMIVRVDIASRKVDTLAYFKIPKTTMNITTTPGGGVSMMSEFNPLPTTDDWAILSNGTIVIARGQDYHVDIVGPNGSVASSAPKIPFEWQRLTDEDKVAFVDSVKSAMEKARANPAAGGGPTIISSGGPVIVGGDVAVGRGGGGGGGGQTMTFFRGAEGGAGPGMGGMPGGQLNLVSPSQLPDYKPAFGTGSLRADADGNLWVRTIPTKPLTAGPIYDVINSKGQLIDRVQVPASRTIVGFGPGGTVYMSVREGTGLLLEKAKVR